MYSCTQYVLIYLVISLFIYLILHILILWFKLSFHFFHRCNSIYTVQIVFSNPFTITLPLTQNILHLHFQNQKMTPWYSLHYGDQMSPQGPNQLHTHTQSQSQSQLYIICYILLSP